MGTPRIELNQGRGEHLSHTVVLMHGTAVLVDLSHRRAAIDVDAVRPRSKRRKPKVCRCREEGRCLDSMAGRWWWLAVADPLKSSQTRMEGRNVSLLRGKRSVPPWLPRFCSHKSKGTMGGCWCCVKHEMREKQPMAAETSFSTREEKVLCHARTQSRNACVWCTRRRYGWPTPPPGQLFCLAQYYSIYIWKMRNDREREKLKDFLFFISLWIKFIIIKILI